MVPEGRRHATNEVCTGGEAAIRAVSLVQGAGGDRPPTRAGPHHAGSRSPSRAGSIDDLSRAAAQRRHPKRRPGVSRHDSAMACRAICSPPEADEACSQCGIASLCGGTTGWRGRRSKRGSCSRPDRALERPSAWTTARPAVGKRLEPGADRQSSADRLPGR